MKKSLQNRKITLTARVILILLLIISALNFVGCTQEQKYEFLTSRCYSDDAKSTLSMYVFSYNNVFDIDNVNVNVSYGIHELNIFGQVKSNPKEQLPYIFQQDKLLLSVCLCNDSHWGKDENCVEIKQVSDEELFSKKYGYIDTPFFISGGIVYMNTDTVKIPAELFDEEYGKICIKLIFFSRERRC